MERQSDLKMRGGVSVGLAEALSSHGCKAFAGGIMKSVGVIGVGLLGTAMAERLMSQQFGVVGFDVNESRNAELLGLGGFVAGSAIAVANASKTIILSLPTSDHAISVIDQLLESLTPEHCIIDTTTGAPEQMENNGRRLADLGVDYLDATVGGSSVLARQGDVTITAGGSIEAYAACLEVFDALARQSFHVGPVGSGARMKLVMNMVLGLNRAVLAEGLCFAKSLGFDLDKTLEVLQAGPAQSAAMMTKGRKMIEENFEPQARLAQHLKDVRLMISAASQANASIPMTTMHAEILEQAEQMGFGNADNSAVIKAFQSH